MIDEHLLSEWALCARPCAKHIISSKLLNPHSNPIRLTLLLRQMRKMRHRGLCYLLKDIWLGNGRVRIIPGNLAPNPFTRKLGRDTVERPGIVLFAQGGVALRCALTASAKGDWIFGLLCPFSYQKHPPILELQWEVIKEKRSPPPKLDWVPRVWCVSPDTTHRVGFHFNKNTWQQLAFHPSV
jgi:hypothetical protein